MFKFILLVMTVLKFSSMAFAETVTNPKDLPGFLPRLVKSGQCQSQPQKVSLYNTIWSPSELKEKYERADYLVVSAENGYLTFCYQMIEVGGTVPKCHIKAANYHRPIEMKAKKVGALVGGQALEGIDFEVIINDQLLVLNTALGFSRVTLKVLESLTSEPKILLDGVGKNPNDPFRIKTLVNRQEVEIVCNIFDI